MLTAIFQIGLLPTPLIHLQACHLFNLTPSKSAQIQLNLNISVTPLHPCKIEITARVLSAEHYTFGREADLAKVDLALGWGPMSDDVVLKQIGISQSNRVYYWHVNTFPIPREAIGSNSANMHMVAADAQIEKTLQYIRPGQSVKIIGYLIQAKADDGWKWKSSLSRQDTGMGTCELVNVKTILVN